MKAPSNGFVDTKQFMPAQYYRLFISFEGGTYIFTESHKPAIDTQAAMPQLSENFKDVKTWFIPSKQIYTGRDNNVIMALPDANKKKYSVKFFEDDGTFLFEIKTIGEPYLTVDKVNFVHSGLFRFELYADGVLAEKHKVYIPKDGKPIPPLDVQGYEVK